MTALLRPSRIRHPRSTRGSAVLLLFAFSLFGVWADSAVRLGNDPQTSAVEAESVLLICASSVHAMSDPARQHASGKASYMPSISSTPGGDFP